MRLIIEVKDNRDKDSSEPWSFFGAAANIAELKTQLAELAQYLVDYPTVVETRIRNLSQESKVK